MRVSELRVPKLGGGGRCWDPAAALCLQAVGLVSLHFHDSVGVGGEHREPLWDTRV